MYCYECNRETDFDTCPICGSVTHDELPTGIFWCDNCNIPLIDDKLKEKHSCGICNSEARYLCTDIRPVFPEERLIFEFLEGVNPYTYINHSVWAVGSKYFVDGKPHNITIKQIKTADASELRKFIEDNSLNNKQDVFEENIRLFCNVNSCRLHQITEEAFRFIQESSLNFPEERIVVSFSGGKDSTVVADLVVRALSNPSIVHIFGDTTLEFPETTSYAERFRANHPYTIFKTARNNELSFYDVAKELGPPARMMRWCCSMFKTGPITRAFSSLYGDNEVLTFQGVRRFESTARSKYNRIEDNAESVKIQKQKVALPIFNWKDIEVWLYILSEELDFNSSYRMGYERVGCWCCPNNNPRAEFLSKLTMPEDSKQWHEFLVTFAKSIGKEDAETYVDTGKWKARQGGNGLPAAKTVKVMANKCATEDDAFVFSLTRPFNDELINLMTPIGTLAPDLGRKILQERVYVNPKTNEPLFSIMPFENSEIDHGAKARILSTSDSDWLVRSIKYQVVKFNACRQCLKCESLCRFGAISVQGGEYRINSEKCLKCKQCITDKYLEGGCLMSKYLRTKD